MEFDENIFVQLLKESNSYEEFRLKLDIEDIECIISKDEYDHFWNLYKRNFNVDDLTNVDM